MDVELYGVRLRRVPDVCELSMWDCLAGVRLVYLASPMACGWSLRISVALSCRVSRGADERDY